MNIRERRAIHRRCREILAAAPNDPRKVALCYTAITALMALISTVLTAVLTDRIANTGGLSNMGLRSILSTGQVILPIVQLIVNACLSLGYHYAVLRMIRGDEAQPRDLLEGFRLWGPILRAVFLQSMIYLFIGIGSMYLSTYIFLATPMAESFYTVMEPLIASASGLNGQITVDAAAMDAATDALMPMLWIWLGVFLIAFLPAYYNYRMTNFCLADDPRAGALAAMFRSKRMLRRNRFALLKLDLSMWWFYLLQFFISAICYGDVFLAIAGIRLPLNGTFVYYFFFILSLIVQIVTYYFLMNRVYGAYALAYESLREPPKPKAPDFPFPTEL